MEKVKKQIAEFDFALMLLWNLIFSVSIRLIFDEGMGGVIIGYGIILIVTPMLQAIAGTILNYRGFLYSGAEDHIFNRFLDYISFTFCVIGFMIMLPLNIALEILLKLLQFFY